MLHETIVITGASSGVGAATARLLARPGRRLLLLARRMEALVPVADTVRQAGATAEMIACDVADAAAVEAAFAQAGADIHALVNAAALPAGTVAGAATDEIERVVAVNMVGTMLCCRAALPRMAPGAMVINIGSLCVRLRDGGASLYVAAKLGVAGFTDAFRKEVAADGIRVVMVNPGQIASGMVTETEAQKQQAVADERMLLPEDVASVIRFCLEQPHRVVITELEVRPRAQSCL